MGFLWDTLGSSASQEWAKIDYSQIWNPVLEMADRPAGEGRHIMMMDGYGMGFGGIGMLLVTVLVILAIAALVKYLMK